METESLSGPVYEGEIAFLRALQDREADYVVALGLPKDYFSFYHEAIETEGEDLRRPVFLTLSAEAQAGLARSGAESYLLTSVPGKPPRAENEAREKAKATLDRAQQALSPVRRRLVSLNASEDLYYLYQAQLLADLHEGLIEAFPDRPLVVAMRNRDARWRVLGGYFPVRLVDVKGPFRKVEVSDLPYETHGTSEPFAGGEAGGEADPAEAWLEAIDRWAEKNRASEEPICSLKNRVQGPVSLVCWGACGTRPTRDGQRVADLAGHLRGAGRHPVFFVENAAAGEVLRGCGEAYLCAEDLRGWQGDGEAAALSLDCKAWPFSVFSGAESWRRRLQRQIQHYSLAAKVASAMSVEDVHVVPCDPNGTCMLEWALARRQGDGVSLLAPPASGVHSDSAASQEPAAEVLDAEAQAGEAAFLRAIKESPYDFLIAQGLPGGYFTHYQEALDLADMPPPVFIHLSSKSTHQQAETGAECYWVSSLPDLPREDEIRAYEQAHAAVGRALEAMSADQSELALLMADNDLQIIALTFFFAGLPEYFRTRFAGRKIVLTMRNIDDSYELLIGNLPCRWLKVSGAYKSVDVTDWPRQEAYAYPAEFQTREKARAPVRPASTYFDALDAWAKANWTGDTALLRLTAASARAGVLIHCQHPPERFSFQALLRVAGEVARRGKRPIFVTRDEGGAKAARQAGYEALAFDAIGTQADADLPGFLDDMSGLVWPYDVLASTKGWRRRARVQLKRYSAAGKLMAALQPVSLMIYPYGSQPSRVTNLAATRRGVPIYEPIMMGVGGHARGFPVIDKRTTFLAYGTEGRELMEAFGVSPGQLVVTGNARYDPLTGHQARRDEYRQVLLDGAEPDTTLIVVATTGLMELDRLWLDDACRSAAELGVRLVIKPHPAIGLGPYRRWLDRGPHVAGWEGELDEAIAACDAMVTDYSSTGWEAVLYNRPLIVVNFSGTEFRYRWEDEGVGVRVCDARQLHEQFRRVGEGRFSAEVLQCQRRITPRYNHLNDGKAAERMAMRMLRERPWRQRLASWTRRRWRRQVARRLLGSEPAEKDGRR